MSESIGEKYKSLLGNIGVFAIANGASKFVPFAMVPLYTRYLTTGEYGITDLFNTTINLAVPLLSLSVASGALRYCIDDVDKRDQYFALSVLLTLLSCLICFLLLPVLSLPVFGGMASYGGYVVVAYASVAFSQLFSSVARAYRRNRSIVVASVGSALVNLALSFMLIVVCRLGVEGFFIAYCVSNVFACLVYLVGISLSGSLSWSWRASRPLLRNLVLYSLPLVPNALFWWMTNSISRYFITLSIGVSAVGIFAAASKLPGLLNVVAGVFQQAWALSAFQEYRSGEREQFYLSVYRRYNAVMVVLAALLIFSSKWLTHILLGSGFFEAWSYIPILMLSFYASSVSSFVGTMYTARMETKGLFFTTGLGAILCLLLTAALIPPMGMQGACVAAAASNVVISFVRMADVNRSMRIGFSVQNNALATTLLLLLAIAVLFELTAVATALVVGAALWSLKMIGVSRIARKLRKGIR